MILELKNMTVKDIQKAYEKIGYFCSIELAIAVKNALVLEKPIVIEGPPGVGKTELAKATSKLLNQELLRLQCTPEINERKALYDFNYSKQLMFIQLLKDQIVSNDAKVDAREWIKNFDQNNPFYSESFLIKRPVLEAFCPTNGIQKVLLIDEIDKAESEFEFSLLEAFSDYTISVPEIGTVSAEFKPVTIITSNRERKLTDTLLRRCIYLYVEYPTIEEETNILFSKTSANKVLAQQIATLVASFRNLGLSQNPSIAETMEWAEVLSIHCNGKATREHLTQNLSVIAKNKNDQEKIREKIAG